MTPKAAGIDALSGGQVLEVRAGVIQITWFCEVWIYILWGTLIYPGPLDDNAVTQIGYRQLASYPWPQYIRFLIIGHAYTVPVVGKL
jgi:hypothetical protein